MGSTEESLRSNLRAVRAGVERACARVGRDPAEVLLVAASKSVGVPVIVSALRVGITDFAENYVNELRAKHEGAPTARWHYIGTLQTGSVHHVAALADVVQTIAGGRATDRLARRAAESGRIIEAMIEVDFTGERTGASPADVPRLADRVAMLEGLRLAGLMTVPAFTTEAEDARPTFAKLRELRELIASQHPQVLELSMGMSLDYEVAVEEGATMVRVGTALFGPRVPST